MARKKYMYIEDFPITEEEAKSGSGSPQGKVTKNFGMRILHQIAKCVYVKNNGGETVKRGETGGWIENYSNLSQTGDCWVHSSAYVCGNASVTGDAQIKSGEVGDSASVSDNAEISGNAVVKGFAKVFGEASIEGNSSIEDNAKVNCTVRGKTIIKNNATAISFRTQSQGLDLARQIGFKEGDNYEAELIGGSLIQDSTLEEDAVVRGNFNILNSKLCGKAYVVGRGSYKIQAKGLSTIVYDVMVKDAEIKGKSIVQGIVVGPVVLEDYVAQKMMCAVGDTNAVVPFLPTNMGNINEATRELKYLISNFR